MKEHRDRNQKLYAIRKELSELKDENGYFEYPDYEFKDKTGRRVKVTGINAVPWSAVYAEEERQNKYFEDSELMRAQGLASREREQQRSELDMASEQSFPSMGSTTKKTVKGVWSAGVSESVKSTTKPVVKAISLKVEKKPKRNWASDSESDSEDEE